MKPHQQRVVDELAELQTKTDKLGEFFSNALYKTLDPKEADRLTRQWRAMCEYASILRDRIAAFEA
jgi:hypothetical protein